ncbi:uncharacterized protein LOC106658593 [Trichogramma pretiosum]|uniref:uncharacterized protein LOC106658593 n=1 Tax=Trichogramma pretiosum TaxID=7493 RepID=UPI000C718CE2|nr:uncharacterized protein LOC106658593 [Trichogramma pretiosum]
MRYTLPTLKKTTVTILLCLWLCSKCRIAQCFDVARTRSNYFLGNDYPEDRNRLWLGHMARRRIVAQPVARGATSLGLEPKSDELELPRSYYGMPAAPFVPAFDPISVLASLAFLAFLLQSFAALFDRTRAFVPTIVSSRRSSKDNGEQFEDIEKQVLRALEEYASTSNNVLGDEKEREKSTTL